MSKKIIVCNDTAYGYSSSTNTFTQIISGWSSRTPDQKNTLLNSVSESDITGSDLQSIGATSSTDSIHLEVYDTVHKRYKVNIIPKYIEETIKPKKLIDISYLGSDVSVTGISFKNEVADNSYIKILFTTDLINYYKYDSTNKKFVSTDIDLIKTEGNNIGVYLDNSVSSFLGKKFALAYFIHREPYTSDPNIDNLYVNVDISYTWDHCSSTVVPYEYHTDSLLSLTFTKSGDYKINYQDIK